MPVGRAHVSPPIRKPCFYPAPRATHPFFGTSEILLRKISTLKNRSAQTFVCGILFALLVPRRDYFPHLSCEEAWGKVEAFRRRDYFSHAIPKVEHDWNTFPVLLGNTHYTGNQSRII
jgi:hypothetical protein